jgi:hypothetical protein
LFVPTAAVLIALAQVAVVSFAERVAWYISAPIIVFFGVILAAAGMVPVQIAPDGKVRASVIVSLFVLFEVVALLSFIPDSPLHSVIARLYADLVIVLGTVAGTSDRQPAPA